MILPAEAQKRAQETLVGFSPEIIAAYVGFIERGNPTDLDAVVLGVLQFYLAHPPEKPLLELPGTTRLIEDLGCDSLSMMDMVFMIEGLFDIKLKDEELRTLLTLDDLRRYLRGYFSSNPTPAG